ncbi:MAG: TerB family tellurite resistance protein [Halieaceae bacterium]|nr:MAG: TerB family tellurite resistance protein [Halieaceae bacterium]
MLIAKLKTLFRQAEDAQAQSHNRALELTCAALMFEVARADFTVEATELDTVNALLTEQFDLAPEELLSVTEQAAQQADAATCLYEFTRTLNELASAEEKRALLAMMWRVAMADDVLSRYEEHLIRKVADLLYVPHSDFMAAKQQAL